MSTPAVPIFTAREAELKAAGRALIDRCRQRRKAGDVRGAMRAYGASLRVHGWLIAAYHISK